MPAARNGKGRGAAASPPSEDRLDRMEAMMERLMSMVLPASGGGSVGIDPDGNTVRRVADEEDDGDDLETDADRQRHADEEEAADKAAELLIDKRHVEILDWLCRVQGKGRGQMIKELLRSVLIRERPAFREAQGKGGHSSRDLGALSERLPRK